MTTDHHNPNPSARGPESAEETLRIVASLPAPEGLEDRIHAALGAAPRHARVLRWPTALKPQSNWMRTAAAAAIVFVVVGGGWGVYTRVEQNRPAKVIVMPPRIASPGGFSGAGAVRTPETIPGPAAPQVSPVKDGKKRAAKAGSKAAKKDTVTAQGAGQK